jgi:nucleoid-associated protein YgaU
MKTFLMTMVALMTYAGVALAQVPPPPASKPDEQLLCDEADARILQFQGINNDLKSKLEAAKAGVAKLENDLAAEIAAAKKCNDDLYALLGASEADIAAFRQRLGQLEGRVREMQRLSDDQLADRQAEVRDLERQLNALRRERVAVMPEFFDRIVALGRDIKGLYREKKIKGYVVGTWAENRDCLWNIAGRTEIYGDPFQWPKIWQANTDQIKNPDVIQPGWVLQVPPAGPKSDDETKAERMYWRKKRAAAAAAEASAGTPSQPEAPATQKKASEAGN